MITLENKETFQRYLSDASNFQGQCDTIYIPESKEELHSLVIQLYKNKTQITIAGNGTGLTGGRVPVRGVVISLEKFNGIRNFNSNLLTVETDSAVILRDLQNYLNARGYFYPPDPTETNCFVGGTIACNASGAKSFSYGSTRNFVNKLHILLPTGENLFLSRGENIAQDRLLKITTDSGRVIEFLLPDFTPPQVKNAAGYFIKNGMDAIDLFIGSEGTLGIIVSAELKFLQLPPVLISCVAFFDDINLCLNFLDKARKQGKSVHDKMQKVNSKVSPRALEFFDANALNFLRDDYPNIPENTACAVWFEQETTSEEEDELLAEWLNFLEINGADTNNIWYAKDDKMLKEIRTFRHAISYKVNEYIARNNFRKLGTDVAVPVAVFNSFYFQCTELVASASIPYVCYGHFGDCHIHLNMLPRNSDEYSAGKDIYKNICRLAVEYGGTVSAEHGIGKLKHEYLELMYSSEQLRQMAEIKKIFDPLCLLNVGNIIPSRYFS